VGTLSARCQIQKLPNKLFDVTDKLNKSRFKFFFSRFFYESERGIHPQTEFVFDLELPVDFVPTNNDGEVEEFELVPVAQVDLVDVVYVGLNHMWILGSYLGALLQ